MSEHEQWHLSPEAAERYERVVVRYILGPWAPLLVDAAGVAAGEHVLDVACGTGVVARVAAKRVGPDGRVVLRYVRTGGHAGSSVEVRSGLQAGERVVLDPPADLEAGTRVSS